MQLRGVKNLEEGKEAMAEVVDMDEYQKLVHATMNDAIVEIDNSSSATATVVTVNRGRSVGALLDAVQVISDLDLLIKGVHFSTDAHWVMAVFHVADSCGQKLEDVPDLLTRIELSLAGAVSGASTDSVMTGLHGVEFTSPDEPGILSDVFGSIRDRELDVVESTVWTHSGRVGSVIFMKDPDRGSNTMTHSDRRLHQLMDSENDHKNAQANASSSSAISVEDMSLRRYSVVTVRCGDRAKLLFDVVCTLYDMDYEVFHASVSTEADSAFLEFFIRGQHGNPICCDKDRQQLIGSLRAAVERRVPKGLRLELRTADRRGLLAEVTRVFHINGLSVKKAEIKTVAGEARDVFYVAGSDGHLPDRRALTATIDEIGADRLKLIDELPPPKMSSRDMVSAEEHEQLRPGSMALKSLSWVGDVVRQNLRNLIRVGD